MTIEQSFIDKVVAKTGWNPTTVSQILSAWQPYEGGHDKNNATYNPLNTTQDYPGAKPINSYGVKAYPSEDAGVDAFIKTIQNGRYPHLVEAFTTGNVDPKGIAQDVRVWTSGSPTGGSLFADTLDQGGGITPGATRSGTPTATDNLRKGQEERVKQLEKLLDEGFAAEPPDSMDETTGINPHDSWARRMQILNTSLQNAYAALGRKDQNFANDLATTEQSIKLDTLGQNRDTQLIDRFLGGLQESRARSQQIADAKKELRMYGTPSGKTSFSYSDLGAGFEAEARRMGIDPTKPLVNYPGTVWLDPEADQARFDQQFGVTGQIPGIGSLHTQFSDIPQQARYGAESSPGPASSAPWWPSNPQGQSEIDTSPSSLLPAAPFSPWGSGAGQMIGPRTGESAGQISLMGVSGGGGGGSSLGWPQKPPEWMPPWAQPAGDRGSW